jgi:hypothetical protein
MTLVEESQFEVEPSDSETRGRLSTLALGYLMGDREESGILLHQSGMAMKTLCIMFNCG